MQKSSRPEPVMFDLLRKMHAVVNSGRVRRACALL